MPGWTWLATPGHSAGHVAFVREGDRTAIVGDTLATFDMDSWKSHLAWPREIARPIVGEVHRVLTEQRGGVLTLGALFALYFSSSGVESLRVGLNRAYGLRETRPWWLTRLESIGYVVCGACAMLAFALLVVLGPLIWRNVVLVAPGLEPLGLTVAIGRIAVTAALLAFVLVIAHKFVAAGRRSTLAVLPGIGVTLLLWFFAGLGFGYYLDRFSHAYASTYGGLATAMVFLVFLYWLAAMFLLGGEVNGTVIAARRVRLQARMLARRAERDERSGTGRSGEGHAGEGHAGGSTWSGSST